MRAMRRGRLGCARGRGEPARGDGSRARYSHDEGRRCESRGRDTAFAGALSGGEAGGARRSWETPVNGGRNEEVAVIPRLKAGPILGAEAPRQGP
jgi:hypothetical protein